MIFLAPRMGRCSNLCLGYVKEKPACEQGGNLLARTGKNYCGTWITIEKKIELSDSVETRYFAPFLTKIVDPHFAV